MASKGYTHAGSIEVESAKLVLDNGQVIDIQNVVREVNIYESLFNHYVEAEFVMDDSLNLFAAGSTGQELVDISFRNSVGPGVDAEYQRKIFQVYEISNRKRISEFRQVYVMNCVTPEKYLTTPTKISRAFGPSTIGRMVQKIFNEFVYNNAAKDFYREAKRVFGYELIKLNDFDETSGVHELIIPNMPVDDAIYFLCKEADSEDHIPYYVFYEDMGGFKFHNISRLISRPIAFKYHHLPTATKVPSVVDIGIDMQFDDSFKIISYELVKQSNILQNTNMGLFRNETINLDLHRRKSKTKIYDYDEYSSKFKSIENKVLGGSLGKPVLTLGTTRTGHDRELVFSKENHFPKRIDQTSAISKGYERSLFNLIMEVTVPGNATLRVGQIIELEFYISDGSKIPFESVDKYLSGKYLVTKVRQKINGAKSGSEYLTVIECTRDGIREN